MYLHDIAFSKTHRKSRRVTRLDPPQPLASLVLANGYWGQSQELEVTGVPLHRDILIRPSHVALVSRTLVQICLDRTLERARRCLWHFSGVPRQGGRALLIRGCFPDTIPDKLEIDRRSPLSLRYLHQNCPDTERYNRGCCSRSLEDSFELIIPVR